MRRADPRVRSAVQQVILRQRPSQVCDTNIQSDAVTVLGSGVPAGLTVFGHSDSSNDDKAKRKYHDRDQPNQGRGRVTTPHPRRAPNHNRKREADTPSNNALI